MNKPGRDRMTGPDQVWVCGACGRTREGDRYDMGDSACVLHAVLCDAVKGCKCTPPCEEAHWLAVEKSDPAKDASS